MKMASKFRKGFSFIAFLFVALGMVSCRTYKKQIPTGSAFRTENVYVSLSYDHSKILNVFLLPLENPYEDPDLEVQRSDLSTSLLRNFAKFHYFHINCDKSFSLENRQKIVDLETGKIDAFKVGALGREYNAQAIMKVSISEYRPYFPMRMNIRALLLDSLTGERIWAFDEIFDSDDAEVVNGMRYWWNSRIAGGDETNRFSLSKLRPSFFMNYIFYTMADSYARTRVKNVKAIERLKVLEERKVKSIKEKEKRIYGRSSK